MKNCNCNNPLLLLLPVLVILESRRRRWLSREACRLLASRAIILPYSRWWTLAQHFFLTADVPPKRSPQADHQLSAMMSSSTSGDTKQRKGPLFFASYYLLFGLLHEISHVAIAFVLIPSSYQAASRYDLIIFLVRASLGRYCLIDVGTDGVSESSSAALRIAAIRHFGWMFSLGLAAWVHWHHRNRRRSSSSGDGPVWEVSGKGLSWLTSAVFEQPMFVVAAYVTALEGMATDLLGLVPVLYKVRLLLILSNVRFWIIRSLEQC